MVSAILRATLTALPLVGASVIRRDQPNCFPYGSAQLPADLGVPNVSRDDWWCPQSMAYGFQGFSYPLENDDCNGYENTFDAMNQDFAQMKRDFGASIVRMYYPTCTQSVVFENALKAAATNNMAIIFQVWTNFGGGDVWRDSQQAIYDTLDNPEFSKIAPYVVHSAEFGSEPVGDNMDKDNLAEDLGKFREKLKAYGIPVGISDDWDRPGKLTTDDGSSLADLGEAIKANSYVAHIHPMPFYHCDPPVSDAWAFIQKETQFVLDKVQLPTMISETQWAWGQTEHNPHKSDVGPQQYIDFWKTIDANCAWFKEKNVGWFFHAWRGEDTFDIVKPDGSYAIPDWRPQKC